MSILLVEDEVMISMDLEMTLEDAGYGHVVAVTTVAAALRKIAEQEFSAALLDLNLDREDTVAVADELVRRDVPFLLVTGREPRNLPERLQDRPVVRKPYGPTQIVRALDAAIRAKDASVS